MNEPDPEWLIKLDTSQQTELNLSILYCNRKRQADNDDDGFPSNLLPKLRQKLLVNKHLTYLNLSDCNVSGSGLNALAAVLQQNKTLTHVNLKRNNIPSHSVLDFIDRIHKNWSLTTLELEESGGDIHSKTAGRHESFTLDSVEQSMLPTDPEVSLFPRAVEKLECLILKPNRDNLAVRHFVE